MVTRALAAAALAGGLGCAGFDLLELPPEPIAFVHRTSEQGQQRAELLDPEQHSRSRPGASILRVEDAVAYLTGAERGTALVESFGRLSLLDPRTLTVTPLGVGHAGSQPVEWSLDHRKLRFSSMPARLPQVFEYDADTGEVSRLTSGQWAQAYASVRGDGRVAFSRAMGGAKAVRSQIWVREPGSPPRPVSQGPSDYRPLWSPDGRFLLFATTLASGTPGIARVDPDAEAPPQVVARGRDPVFTRDGEWVVYSQQVQGTWRLWRMRPDGGGKNAIGGGAGVKPFDEVHPAVSPDGRFVAYVSREAERDKLRIRRMDGSGDRPLLEAGDGDLPVW